MIKAIIFDLDGVISDTQTLHSQIESAIFRRYGIDKSEEEITEKYAGVPCEVFFKEVFLENSVPADINKIVKEKQNLIIERCKGNVSPMRGAMDLIKEARQKGFKLAIASSSPIDFVNLIIEELNLEDTFKVVVTVEDVQNGKPDPEIFLLAAKRLGVAPEECIAIEDGRSGMQAAKSAGMKCIGLAKDKGAKDYPADILVENLSEININTLTSLEENSG